MTVTKPILLAEDNPRDAELALAAMEEYHLADMLEDTLSVEMQMDDRISSITSILFGNNSTDTRHSI